MNCHLNDDPDRDYIHVDITLVLPRDLVDFTQRNPTHPVDEFVEAAFEAQCGEFLATVPDQEECFVWGFHALDELKALACVAISNANTAMRFKLTFGGA